MNVIDRFRCRRANVRRARAIAMVLRNTQSRSVRDELLAITNRY